MALTYSVIALIYVGAALIQTIFLRRATEGLLLGIAAILLLICAELADIHAVLRQSILQAQKTEKGN